MPDSKLKTLASRLLTVSPVDRQRALSALPDEEAIVVQVYINIGQVEHRLVRLDRRLERVRD
jgi:hypothetical protein